MKLERNELQTGSSVSVDNMSEEVKRLPCRGCTVRCGLYDRCNGALWRLGLPNESAGPHEPG